MPASPPLPDLVPLRVRRLPVGPRVLLVARWPVGGIRTHLACNVPALAGAGYRCTFVAPEDCLPGLRASLAGVAGCEFTGAPTLWRAVRAQLAGRSFGLVHAHGLTAAAHACLGAWGTGVPLVVTLHEPLRQARFAGLAGQARRWLLGRALARAAAVVTVSDDSRANLLRFFPNLRAHQERIHAIHNGIDTRPCEDLEPGEGLRRELGLDGDTTLIGFLGRFMPEKGFPLLLEAATRLARHGGTRPFHVVAFGSGDYEREYRRDIERQGLARHFSLRDFTADVPGVLSQLDLVVVPSLWEASSLVSMEAMSAGVPVLGADCPGLREVLRDTPSRTFPTGVAAELETALRRALAKPWTEAAGEFAPEARRRFDNRRSARRLVALYDEVTSAATAVRAA
jgi:glycosyltransferase involved in cell wall biosynthesis